LVHARDPGYRPVTKGGRTVSCGTVESEWRLKRSRHSDDVNAKVREAACATATRYFPVSLWRNSEIIKRSFAQALFRTGTGRDIVRFLLDKS
jgi:hypothetical protein